MRVLHQKSKSPIALKLHDFMIIQISRDDFEGQECFFSVFLSIAFDKT